MTDNPGHDTVTAYTTIIFNNIRSLRSNHSLLVQELEALDNKPDLICLQEIWEPHPSQEILLDYNRLISNTRKHKRGGGVGIFIKKGILHDRLNTINENLELLSIHLPEMKTVLMNIYRAPNIDPSTFLDELASEINHIINKLGKIKIILGGDFNIDLLKHSKAREIFLGFCDTNSLAPLIQQTTRNTSTSQTCIDNILINNTQYHEAGVFNMELADHLATYIKIHTPVKGSKNRKTTTRKITDFNELENIMKIYNWAKVYNGEIGFIEAVDSIITASSKEVKINGKYCRKQPWMTKALLISRRRKLQLLKKYINTKEHITKAINKHIFTRYQKIYYKLVKLAKKLELEREIRIAGNNGKRIWELTNRCINRNKKNDSDITHIKNNDIEYTKDQDIANQLNKHFISIGQNLAAQIPAQNNNFERFLTGNHKKMIFRETNYTEVSNIIKAMKPKNSCGHDNMNNKTLKRLRNFICKPLTWFINSQIRNNHFPDAWKLGKVVPLHKGGDKSDPNNYRPISLLPTFSKVFEKVLEKQIRAHLQKENILSNDQYGFRPRHSTLDAQMDLIREVETNKLDKKHTLALFIDLKKAFDTVNTIILLKKLEHYGIDSTIINSYLSNRAQYTTTNGCKSSTLQINCGVPQGSILGPLLFVLYINDLPTIIKGKTVLYADDSTFLFSNQSIQMLEYTTNQEIKKAQNWFTANYLTLHPKKTKCLLFDKPTHSHILNIKLDNTNIEMERNFIKFLGLLIDPALNWKQHKEHVLSKIRRNFFLIRCNKDSLPTKIKILLYNALIKPYLEYSLLIWGHGNNNKIEILQRKIIRVLANKTNNAHTSTLFARFNILKLKDLICLNTNKIIIKFLLQTLPNNTKNIFKVKRPRKSLRSQDQHNILETTTLTTARQQTSYLCNMPILWNNQENDIRKTLDLEQMQEVIKTQALSKYEAEICTKYNCYACSHNATNAAN